MKTKILKSIIPAAALALTLNLSSCIGDLDVTPINPQQTMEFDNDAVFNKIYASFSLTGQSGPNGNGDIDDVDEGRSGMFRSQWYLNEFTADEAHWVWGNRCWYTGIASQLMGGKLCIFGSSLLSSIFYNYTL